MANPGDFDWIGAGIASGLGLIGRLMSLAQEQRAAFTVSLIWELPIAVGMGLIGRGIGEYCGLQGFALFSASIVAAYLGPRIISVIVARLVRRIGA